jgi:hypothetical protein
LMQVGENIEQKQCHLVVSRELPHPRRNLVQFAVALVCCLLTFTIPAATRSRSSLAYNHVMPGAIDLHERISRY